LLNAMDGAPRTHARYRPTDSGRSASSMRLSRRVERASRALAVRISTISDRARALHAAVPRRVVRHVRRRSLVARFASERTLPVGVGLLVLLATVASIAPGVTPAVGATSATGSAPRIAIGGGDGGARYHAAEVAGLLGGPAARVGTDRLTTDPDDGTLWKPVAVDTTVQDATGLIKHYVVQTGDSLSGIATKFGLSMMTLWWANNLTSKDALSIGQTLVIPPVDGLVTTVKVGDTLDTLAAKNKITTTAILDANHLTDSNLIVGQTLLLPGAAGDPIPLPKIVAAKPSTRSSGGASAPSTAVYPSGGGAWAWPVVGRNYVSQYFSGRHPAVDIAGTYGNPIVSALPGTVVYAGWKDNGGGYQVWVSHGNGLYTGYYHMSAVSTAVGASVDRGQQVGLLGQSGWATGPHCHFEVWVGYPWARGSYRVNGLAYY
jgi:murein DD-endopeptidase MepM/ murein hydrolase activator NlpD